MRAPRGPQISCQSWEQEAALRLFLNTCDTEVCGRAAGSGSVLEIIEALRCLASDQTLLIRAEKPAGIFQSHPSSPRVLILNDAPTAASQLQESQTGGYWFGVKAAGSWTAAGAQDALAATFAVFALAAQKHFKSDLSGKFVVSGGMGARGGAQALAATMNGAAFLGIEMNEATILARIRSGYCDICVNDLDEALRILKNAIRKKEPVSVGLRGNCADVIPELARRGVLPDLLSDQTGAHEPLHGYIPAGMSLQEAEGLRRSNSEDYLKRAEDSVARHAAGLLELQKLGAVTVDFGNDIGARAHAQGMNDASPIPHFVTAYLEPCVRAGIVPVRCFALSGERGDIFKLDDALLALSPQNEILAPWIRMARKLMRFQGLPARVAWLGTEERERFAERVDELVARGELKAPIVISRDVDLGAPIAMTLTQVIDRDDAAARSVVAALREAAPGASWAYFECGAGDPGQQSRLCSQAAVADGTPEAARRLNPALSGDAGNPKV